MEEKANLMSGAVFDGDRYRYALWRFWNYLAAKAGEARAVMFILANPSKAGEFNDDPTVIKYAHYAQGWGYDGMYIGNLFAIISTHWRPWATSEEEAIGVKNDEWLEIMKNSSCIHLAAWGFMGDYHPERAQVVARMFPKLYHLGLAKVGFPKHPLYLPAHLKPILWEKT